MLKQLSREAVLDDHSSLVGDEQSSCCGSRADAASLRRRSGAHGGLDARQPAGTRQKSWETLGSVYACLPLYPQVLLHTPQ